MSDGEWVTLRTLEGQVDIMKTFLVIGGQGDLGQNRILPALHALGHVADVVDINPRPCYLPKLPAVRYEYQCSEPAGVPRPVKPYSGVIVATPNDLHLEHCRWAMQEKVACLVEKPLAHSLCAAEALDDLAARSSQPLLSADHYLFKGPSRWVFQNRHLLGRIGSLQRIRGRLLETAGVSPGRDWLLDPRRSGGGLWTDLGIHLVTFVMRMMNWSCSSVRITGATASSFSAAGGEQSMEVRATCEAVDLEFEVGKEAPHSRKDVLFEGSRGTICVDWEVDTITSDVVRASAPTDTCGGYVEMLGEFADVCDNGPGARKRLVTCGQALDDLRIIKAGYGQLPPTCWIR